MKKRLELFHERFRQTVTRVGKKPEEITVVFATKYINSNQLQEFLTGDVPFPNWKVGENRVQDAARKFTAVPIPFPKVLIGNLQTNKINTAIDLFDELHAIDSVGLAQAVNERLRRRGKRMPIFLEVNVSGEKTKHGLVPFEIDSAMEAMKQCSHLIINGLMTMAPFSDNPEDTRPIFRTLRQFADRYNLKTSMGMSNDWEVAIEEGSDEIRIGSAIFAKERT